MVRLQYSPELIQTMDNSLLPKKAFSTRIQRCINLMPILKKIQVETYKQNSKSHMMNLVNLVSAASCKVILCLLLMILKLKQLMVKSILHFILTPLCMLFPSIPTKLSALKTRVLESSFIRRMKELLSKP